MPNTYTQLYIQFFFAVKFRQAMLHPDWDHRMRQYIVGIIHNNGHQVLAINNMPDHIHIFIIMQPVQSISDLIRLVKGDSSEWINKQRFTGHPFRWQEGNGAFCYSKSPLSKVISYVQNQQQHHSKKKFLDEYREMPDSFFGIVYDEKYLFKDPA